MGSLSTLAMLVAMYLVAGGVVGGLLLQKGQAPAVAASAVVAWPLLLGSLDPGGGTVGAVGPLAARIHASFAEVEAAVRDPAAAGLVTPGELVGLKASLLAVDQRLGMVDRLLAGADVEADPVAERLRTARGHAAAEIDAVLRGLVQLKLQVGLVALMGDTVPVRDRMRELGARVKALEELSLA